MSRTSPRAATIGIAAVIGSAACLDIPPAPGTRDAAPMPVTPVTVSVHDAGGVTCTDWDVGTAVPPGCIVEVRGATYVLEFEDGNGYPRMPNRLVVPPDDTNLIGSDDTDPSESGIGVAFYDGGTPPSSASTNAFVKVSGSSGLTYASEIFVESTGPAMAHLRVTWSTPVTTVCASDATSSPTIEVETSFTFYPDRIVKFDEIDTMLIAAAGTGCGYITSYVTLNAEALDTIRWSVSDSTPMTESSAGIDLELGTGGYDACLRPGAGEGQQVIVAAAPSTPYAGVRMHHFPAETNTVGIVHDWRRSPPAAIAPPLYASAVIAAGPSTAGCDVLDRRLVRGFTLTVPGQLTQATGYYSLQENERYDIAQQLPPGVAFRFKLVAASVSVIGDDRPLIAGYDYLIQELTPDDWVVWIAPELQQSLHLEAQP
jgi:hypothetical protein